MCGIVTVLNTSGFTGRTNREKFLKQGIMVDSLRGEHSTGLLYVDDDGDAEVVKKAVAGYDFTALKKPSKVIGDCEKYPFMVAHNRWATKGKVNTQNAHPFEHDHISGVHNGSLNQWKNLSQGDFDTDSEHIFHGIATDGADKIIPKINGAFVLVWHDASDDTLHMVRNEERPFWLAYGKDGKTVYGMSERDMLLMIANRNNISIDKVFELPVGEEWIFDKEDLLNPKKVKHSLQPVYSYENNYNYNRLTHSSTSTTRRTRRSWDDNLNEYFKAIGIKRDAVAQIFLDTWEAYGHTKTADPNKQYGKVMGTLAVYPFNEIEISSVTKAQWDAIDSWIAEVKVYSMDHNSTLGKNVEKMMLLGRSGSLKGITEDELKDKEELEQEVPAEEDKITYLGKNSRVYTRKQAEEAMKHGCANCGANLDIKDFTSYTFIGDSILCCDCEDIATSLQ